MIRAGHRYPDLLTYTPTQIQTFLIADQRYENERMLAHLTVLNIAAQGGPEDVSRLREVLRLAD
ncbi:hypothetical protein ONV78_24295 [Hahella sp. CR1]|uniref:hypothetical protein n=1 Tax=Hahella sp. CR1 TaxID=2992807 RepID=UPI0024435979|nr:hypothetical protein [Hahella sp. CR1]MDG9670882.1 hypothetical protein [Hahella sp. CR1]